ncbi:hypothetical protein ACQPZF_16655 [Actinosynnema sp. CS-041913]|uniref:hypothetical protein n=1 Tax=Actinosynnema sp. CS-041913 TaxID=3239917 RepID=UPI003D8C37FE
MRFVGVLLGLLVVVCGGCATVGEGHIPYNGELYRKVDEYRKSDAPDRKPFAEFTDREWDELYVFDLESVSNEQIEQELGRKVGVGTGNGSLLAYYQDGKVVHLETSDGGLCSGRYTAGAYVRRGFACWLMDDKYERFSS